MYENVLTKVIKPMIHLTYQSPAVIQLTEIRLELDFLDGSVVDKLTVESTGQQVETFDYASPTTEFNHEWQ